MSRIKQFIPPVLWDVVYRSPLRLYGWFGDYANWEEAEKHSEGYDSAIIIEKVKDATLKVKSGAAPYERDSVLFNRIEYDWPVLTGLLWVAAQHNGNLNVIDFGGSLGSTYWQNRKFLNAIPSVKWNIIEQKAFVECGKRFIEDEKIKFYHDFTSCLQENKPNVVLLSSVLSYVKEPYELLSFITGFNIPFMLIDRLLTVEHVNDRLTVQKVPPHIYKASYPSWLFAKNKFQQFIKQYYEIIEEYDCGFQLNLKSEVKGFILRLQKE